MFDKPLSTLTKASCVHPPHNLILSYVESQRGAGPSYTHTYFANAEIVSSLVCLCVFEFFV